MAVEVGDPPDAKRYEARVDGESKVAGRVARRPECQDLPHQSRSRGSD